MKKQYMSYVKSGLLMIVCLASLEGAAQGFSPAAMEQLKAKRLWFQSQNAAGTAFDDVQNYSNVILGYDLQDGNYCRPQEGQKEATVGVSSEGFINLKNAYVWGSFNFSHENLTDAGYNASIADPFRGMPYYIADQHQSDWEKPILRPALSGSHFFARQSLDIGHRRKLCGYIGSQTTRPACRYPFLYIAINSRRCLQSE